VKIVGVGMASAILVDVTIGRLLLVPAAMALLGARNWYLPSWLDRILPRQAAPAGTPAEPGPQTNRDHCHAGHRERPATRSGRYS